MKIVIIEDEIRIRKGLGNLIKKYPPITKLLERQIMEKQEFK